MSQSLSEGGAGGVVAFYLGERPDAAGRMIESVWSWGDERLEAVHDYVQWLFPLRERSGFNPDAPLLDDAAVEAFRSDARLGERLRVSLRLMLRFYGLRLEEDERRGVVVTKSDEYEEKKRNWLTRGNHNFLRLTRIIKSLALLGLSEHARALFRCLSDIYKEECERIGAVTYSYWEAAV